MQSAHRQAFPLRVLLMAAAVLPVAAQARTPAVDPDAPTVVLVHGAFADASGWDRMLSPELQVATALRIGAHVRSVDAGHVSPLSAPREVSDAILEAAGLKQADLAPGADGG
jgi:hypothetical protein